jgi:outer membrane receptor for ferrienterochelin and colicin
MKVFSTQNRGKLSAAIAFSTMAIIANQNALAAEEIEEITVTGSFIARPANRPQPVSVMDNEELKANQRVTIAEVVRDMPQISSANTTGNWNTPTTNRDTAALRQTGYLESSPPA